MKTLSRELVAITDVHSRTSLSGRDAHALVDGALEDLMERASLKRRTAWGDVITFSPKVFIPLTKLCRDVCHYCTFARPPKPGKRTYLSQDEVLAIARAGAAAGCHEALFTLGDKPELRYRAARTELAELGCETTIDYLVRMCRVVVEETGLLPHVNPGVLTAPEVAKLREVSVSQGVMLESIADRLGARGGPHFGSPDKVPSARLETIAAAGELAVPFTTGILVGIGETRSERIEALLEIQRLHDRYGHIHEVIVQNFRAKPGTKMAGHPEPDIDELLWTIAAARLVLSDDIALQCPPNLSYSDFPRLLDAGINDWGGISPVTQDHVNPEAPWPEVEQLMVACRGRGLRGAARIPLYPRFLRDAESWVDVGLISRVLSHIDGDALARTDRWTPGAQVDPPFLSGFGDSGPTSCVAEPLEKVRDGVELSEADIVALFEARDVDLAAVIAAADDLRREMCGDEVTYVVTRNINYTNVCYFRCGFCAFSKGKLAHNLRGAPYLVPTEEIVRRCREAWDRGAVEVCLQGGIHPAFTGEFYLDVCRAVKEDVPQMHIHAFSALEVWQGAATLGMSLEQYLQELKDAGLSSLPGTAAEVLDDRVRAILCPDKISTRQWLEVHDTAHAVGLRSTTTIMHGHVDSPTNWARHLIELRDQQRRSGGFTEFVPLPFVHMEAPIFLRGRARPGPTFREAVLMHAVGRLALHPWITNIQASWVKLGPKGAETALRAGANDLGGTLMNESISRAAGAAHGQEMPPERLERLIQQAGRRPHQRTTLYGTPPHERTLRSFNAPPLSEPLNPPVREAGLKVPKQVLRPCKGERDAPSAASSRR